MRNFSIRAALALTILALPLAIIGLSAATSSEARAERALDEISETSFRIFGGGYQGTARGERASRSSDDEDAAPARRRTRVAKQSSSDDEQPATRRSRGRQVASLGGGAEFSAPKPSRSLSGGGNVSWAANSGCLNGTLRSAVAYVAANYGSVTVNSTCRSAGHNARVGGAPKSYHLSGDAVDLRVHGNVSGAARYLASLGGGYKHYGGGLFHVDTGPRRPF